MPFLTPGKTSNAIDRNALSLDRVRRNFQRLTQGAATRTLAVDGQSIFVNSGGALQVRVSPTGALGITAAGLAVQVDGTTITIVNNQLVGSPPVTAAGAAGTVQLSDGSGRFIAGTVPTIEDVTTGGLSFGSDIFLSAGSKVFYNSTVLIQAQTTLNNYYFSGSGNLTGSGNNNIGFGTNALANITTGFQNVAFGEGSLLSATTASNNTAFGANALTANTVGTTNVAIGAGSLGSNVSGSENVAIGQGALFGNTTTDGNIAIGAQTLQSNSAGGNVAIGLQCLMNTTTGATNIAIGARAGSSNTTGAQNIGIGFVALFGNTTGTQNVGVGVGALQSNTTASENVGIGPAAFIFNTTGHDNVGVGRSGLTNVTGSNLTLVGSNSDVGVDGLSNATAVGANAIVGASNCLVLGGTGANAVKVGLGTTTPGVLLDLGLAGTALGVIRVAGNTSGGVTIQPQAAAGTWTLTLPNSAGTLNYVLGTDGTGITSWVRQATTFIAAADVVAQTTAQTIVAFTPATTGTFRVGGYVTITAVVTDVLQLQVAYTDENANAQTLVFFPQGLTSANLATTGAFAFPTMDIRSGATAIDVKVVFTTGIGTVTYDAGASISQIS